MLSAELRASFEERGLAHLRAAVDESVCAALRQEVLGLLSDRRVVPESPPPGFAVTPSRTSRIARAHGFDEIWGPSVRAAIDDLLGSGAWQRPPAAGQLLAITLPLVDAAWTLPHKAWHLDYTAPGAAASIPGVQIFLLLDRVEPGGGATVVVSGIHRLVDELRHREGPSFAGRSSEVRRALQREVPWLRELCSLRAGEDRTARFCSAATRFRNTSLQVVELTGEPCDVILVHPWLLHASAPNCGSRPRLVLTERLQRAT
jgi:hypothetical protein